MIVYLSLLAASVILGIPMCRNKVGKIIYCVIMGIALFITAALRRSTGFDYNDYGWLYIGYMSADINDIGPTRHEKGYAMITKLLADYISDYQVIFIILALVFAVGAVFIAYKYLEKPWVGVACFLTVGVYFVSFDFMRQMVAAFIIVYALRYLKKKQFFRYVLVLLFASCFHFSAFFMIPFYFLLRIKLTRITLGIYSVLTAVGVIFSWNILEFVTKFLYKGYFLDLPDIIYGCNPATAIIYGILFFTAFLFRERLEKADPNNRILLNCLLFMFIFEIIGVKHSAVSRLSTLFVIPAAIILVPRLFKEIVNRFAEFAKDDAKKKRTLSAIAVSLIAIFNISIYCVFMAINYNGVMPYRTVFDDFSQETSQQQ